MMVSIICQYMPEIFLGTTHFIFGQGVKYCRDTTKVVILMFMYQMYMNDFYLSLIIHNGANILNSSYIVYFSKLKKRKSKFSNLLYTN